MLYEGRGGEAGSGQVDVPMDVLLFFCSFLFRSSFSSFRFFFYIKKHGLWCDVSVVVFGVPSEKLLIMTSPYLLLDTYLPTYLGMCTSSWSGDVQDADIHIHMHVRYLHGS